MPSVSETYLENRKSIQPNDTNNYDTAHGGVIMRLMDESGAMSAVRFAGEMCVTAGVESIAFRRPVPRGYIAVVESWVYEAGETSVRVRLVVDRENPLTGDRKRTSSSRFTFVAVDESASPVPVPSLTVESERCEELRDRALESEG